MQQTLALEVVAALADSGFSLDELVIKSRELFEQEGIAGFVALLLKLARLPPLEGNSDGSG